MFENDYLMHHGIKGQKWGVRRYQNTDGSLTTAGRARYSKGSGKRAKYGARLNAYDRNRVSMLNEQIDELNEDYQRSHAGRKAALASKPKAEARAEAKRLASTGAIAGGGIGGALAGYTSSPGKAALVAGLGTAIGGLGAAALGSHLVKKKYNKKVKQFKDEPFSNDVKMELNKLIQERNHLDPSQQNRKGRVITKEEYSDYYNAARNELEGGNKHKGLVSDKMYNDYLKNTTTYGSKKNNSDYQDDEKPRKSSRGRKVLKGAAVAGTAALAAGGAYAYNRYKKNKKSTALSVNRISTPKRLGLRDSYTMPYSDVDIIPPSNRSIARNKNDRVINVSARKLRRMQHR